MATIANAKTLWTTSYLNVGYSGGGTLSVKTAATINSQSSNIGDNSGSTGLATVNSTGSTWSNGFLYVGNSGSGNLSITNGGAATASGAGWSATSPARRDQ